MAGTERVGPHPDGGRRRAGRDALPARRRPSPQPCLLEALPYRKDDLTSSYAEGYRSLRDEHGYAVCRVDLRGTGSSAGDATDEYPLVERTDLCTVIAWLAEQEWCDGNVGMFGHVVLRLQLAADRRGAAAGAQGDRARSTPATTAGPTTCTGAATRCGWSTSSTTATT